MNNLPNSSPEARPKRRGCLRLLLVILLLLVLVLAVLHFLAPGIARSVANKQLPKQLGTEASLDEIRLNLAFGRVGLGDLVITQPEGFEGDPLLTLDDISVHAPVSSLLSRDPLLVEKIDIRELRVQLINNTNQVMNVSKLGPAEKPEEKEEKEPSAPPPVHLVRASLQQSRVAFRDEKLDWSIEIDDIGVNLRDIHIAPTTPVPPGNIDAELTFHSPKADGRLRLLAKVGAIDPANPEAVPPLQLALGIVGFDLDLVAPFLKPSPKVAKATFGGSGFDLFVFMEIAPGDTPKEQGIDGHFLLITDGGHKIGGDLGGNLEKPSLPFLSLFGDILGNQFGRVTKLGGNVMQGGLEAGKTVAKTGTAAVKGAAKTVTGFAGGALRTVKGVATLDKDEALGGMKDATVGTVGNAADTVTDTAGTAGKGLKDTAKTVTGGDDIERWWKGVDQRLKQFELEAEKWFKNNPFPTTSDKDKQAENDKAPGEKPDTPEPEEG